MLGKDEDEVDWINEEEENISNWVSREEKDNQQNRREKKTTLTHKQGVHCQKGRTIFTKTTTTTTTTTTMTKTTTTTAEELRKR